MLMIYNIPSYGKPTMIPVYDHAAIRKIKNKARNLLVKRALDHLESTRKYKPEAKPKKRRRKHQVVVAQVASPRAVKTATPKRTGAKWRVRGRRRKQTGR